MQRIIALLLLIVLALPLVVAFILATFDTHASPLFTQKRIGKNGKPFLIYKIRTLQGNYQSNITTDAMISSPLGKWLRKTHIDEFPQLINILLGHMNFVGPRPDTPEYYECLSTEDFTKLTSIKPGITGKVQLLYENEMQILSQQKNPETYYKNVLWKEKVAENLKYIDQKNILYDFHIIFLTLKKIFQ